MADSSGTVGAAEPGPSSGTETPANAMPAVRRVGFGAPLRWLASGFGDMVGTGFRGAVYGALFAFMGLAIQTMYQGYWKLTMGLTAGFFLLGPFVCSGLYALSRQRERREPISLVLSLSCWRFNPKSIGFFAAVLTFLMIVWARVSVVMFALFSTHDFPSIRDMLRQVFVLGNLEFVLVWFFAGFLFASLAFAISVVSVPMMLDRGTDTMMAVFASVRALWLNKGPLYFWAVLIVLLIGASLVFSFVGLLLTAPLVGHATWHAYRDLIAPPATKTH